LAASRADNFYFPPEWRPEYGGISKFAGSKGANQYEQYGIIRFELPFDAWCLKCERHMSKGLRFNAKKDKQGKYFSTQIYSFTTKCPSCDQKFVILTDPQNNTYKFSEGLRKHEQDYEPDINDSAIALLDDETRQLITKDPMYKIQHENEDIRKTLSEKAAFERLTEICHQNHEQDYDLNSQLRKRHRIEKKKKQKLVGEGAARGLAMPLLEIDEGDTEKAKLLHYQDDLREKRYLEKSQHDRLLLQKESIFNISEKRENNSNNNNNNNNNNYNNNSKKRKISRIERELQEKRARQGKLIRHGAAMGLLMSPPPVPVPAARERASQAIIKRVASSQASRDTDTDRDKDTHTSTKRAEPVKSALDLLSEY
jgi:coiled-coil domain-containing protein 130